MKHLEQQDLRAGSNNHLSYEWVVESANSFQSFRRVERRATLGFHKIW